MDLSQGTDRGRSDPFISMPNQWIELCYSLGKAEAAEQRDAVTDFVRFSAVQHGRHEWMRLGHSSEDFVVIPANSDSLTLTKPIDDCFGSGESGEPKHERGGVTGDGIAFCRLDDSVDRSSGNGGAHSRCKA